MNKLLIIIFLENLKVTPLSRPLCCGLGAGKYIQLSTILNSSNPELADYTVHCNHCNEQLNHSNEQCNHRTYKYDCFTHIVPTQNTRSEVSIKQQKARNEQLNHFIDKSNHFTEQSNTFNEQYNGANPTSQGLVSKYRIYLYPP